jgi:hypothetical protein
MGGKMPNSAERAKFCTYIHTDVCKYMHMDIFIFALIKQEKESNIVGIWGNGRHTYCW